MLENFTTRRAGKAHESAAAELQSLIATAREERAALGEMLTQVSLRSANLTQTGKSLAQEQQALEDFRSQLRETSTELERSCNHTAALASDVENVRTIAAQLAADHARLQDATLEAERRNQT